MDHHPTPSDSESTADQPGPSPGGVRPTEEPVEAQPQPAEMTADLDDALLQPPPALLETQQEVIARQEAWVQMMAPLTPEQRLDIQLYADLTTRVWAQLADNPEAPPEVLPAADDLLEIVDNFQRTLQSLPQRTIERIDEFFAHAAQQLGQLGQQRENIHMLRQNVAPFLDGLDITTLTSLQANVAQPDSPKCTICLQHYADNDVIVVLPCHPDHHFHWSCIQSPNFLLN
ncbi:hypothetical protein PGTUg99_016023 [Puccinia graminis f. sp. tritici]|uniref:RING-type E3 ubiquitin transferase n=1 Tax=Puccinia graminis f. sp. tritici TaxID=56615 RepID=A0A5B0RT29_PUCGR|nr:hypothetical protein PGTUg99_016023 [Puccinia graminis f. sp. tritici]